MAQNSAVQKAAALVAYLVCKVLVQHEAQYYNPRIECYNKKLVIDFSYKLIVWIRNKSLFAKLQVLQNH